MGRKKKLKNSEQENNSTNVEEEKEKKVKEEKEENQKKEEESEKEEKEKEGKTESVKESIGKKRLYDEVEKSKKIKSIIPKFSFKPGSFLAVRCVENCRFWLCRANVGFDFLQYVDTKQKRRIPRIDITWMDSDGDNKYYFSYDDQIEVPTIITQVTLEDYVSEKILLPNEECQRILAQLSKDDEEEEEEEEEKEKEQQKKEKEKVITLDDDIYEIDDVDVDEDDKNDKDFVLSKRIQVRLSSSEEEEEEDEDEDEDEEEEEEERPKKKTKEFNWPRINKKINL